MPVARHAADTGAGAHLSGKEANVVSGDLAYLGLAETAALIRDKKLSPVEYTTAPLARIERHDPKLNAFIALMPEQERQGSQILVLDAPGARWQVDHDFDERLPDGRRRDLAVSALDEVRFATDGNGKPLSAPDD